MTATTRPEKSVREPTLDVACELGKQEWKLAMTSGLGVDPWWRTVASGDWRGVERALAQGRARFGLPAVVPVLSCSEAGRAGLWIPRALEQRGSGHRVVDSASIECIGARAARTRIGAMPAHGCGGWCASVPGTGTPGAKGASRAWRCRRPTTAGSRSGSQGSVAPAITGGHRSAFSSRGMECAGNRTAR